MKQGAFRTILLWLATAVGAAAADRDFELKEVAPGVYAAIDFGGKAGANAGFVIGDEAVLIVDTFYKVPAAKALLAEVRRITTKPVRYVVNTHHHIDHVAGNGVFADAGATALAHRNVQDWIQDENLRLVGGDKASADARAAVAALKAPHAGYDEGLDIDLGKRRVRLQYVPGHSGGDTVVWVSGAKVLFAGDIVWHRTAPNLIDAKVEDWLTTLSSLAASPEGTVVVPGHGEVGDVDDLIAFRNYLSDLKSFAEEAHRKTPGDAEARALARLTERYGDWAYFKGLGPTGVKHMLAELAGTKRTPLPVRPYVLFE